jgi:hypothetical protein
MTIETLENNFSGTLESSDIDLHITLEDCQTLSQAVLKLLERKSPYKPLKKNPSELSYLRSLLSTVTERFEGAKNEDIAYELHKTLNTIYDYQINAYGQCGQYDPILMEIMAELEEAWISYEKKRVPVEDYPTDPHDFAKWLKAYVRRNPSSDHDLYRHLSDDCTFEEMSFFFSQEVTIDPRFDDLIAFMQIGIHDPGVKMELASNFWDEMGNGNPEEVHTKMFSKLYDALDIFKEGEQFSDVLERASWQAMACGNTLLYSVLHRQNLNIGLGSLGTVEIISPLRFSKLVKGFKRLGLSDEASQYHTLHISIDARHGNGWLHNAIVPQVKKNSANRDAIFFGSCLRMNTSMDFVEFVQKKFKDGLSK